jgi:predicted nucleic acid-binding protein
VTVLMDFKLEMEYREVAQRQNNLFAAGMTLTEVSRVIDRLANVAEGVPIAFKHRPLSVDKADDLVLDVAINGRADAIVTHNVRHFAAARRFGIKVMRPGEFLATLRGWV